MEAKRFKYGFHGHSRGLCAEYPVEGCLSSAYAVDAEFLNQGMFSRVLHEIKDRL